MSDGYVILKPQLWARTPSHQILYKPRLKTVTANLLFKVSDLMNDDSLSCQKYWFQSTNAAIFTFSCLLNLQVNFKVPEQHAFSQNFFE